MLDPLTILGFYPNTQLLSVVRKTPRLGILSSNVCQEIIVNCLDGNMFLNAHMGYKLAIWLCALAAHGWGYYRLQSCRISQAPP